MILELYNQNDIVFSTICDMSYLDLQKFSYCFKPIL